MLAIGEVHPPLVVLAGHDVGGGAIEVHPHAQRSDVLLERKAAILIQLHRHQAWREFDDMRFQAE